MSTNVAGGHGDFDAMVAEVEEYMRQANQNTIAAPQGVPTVATAAGLPSFCSIWPTAKPIIEILKGFVPAWMRWMVDVLIAAGNRVCGT